MRSEDVLSANPVLADFPDPSRNVFLMVRFRDTDQHQAIIKAIAETLQEYSLSLIRADAKHYHDDLWTNVRLCMEACQYGIAVFETIGELVTSPNVSLELGYMLAKERKCLLLKEKGVRMMQADLAGHLCRPFDADRMDETVRAEVRNWLGDLGITKRAGERLLVYVSHGGTCRDPMAKVITERLLERQALAFQVRVQAAALGPVSSATASRGARRAIEELYGADLLADHRATLISAALIRDADLILVMERSLLGKTLPPEKTRVFKEFFGLDGDVQDPWPDSDDEAARERYAHCRDELRTILEGNLQRLIEFLAARPTTGTAQNLIQN